MGSYGDHSLLPCFLPCVKIAESRVCVTRMNCKLITLEYLYLAGNIVFNKMSMVCLFFKLLYFLTKYQQILSDIIQNTNRLMKLILGS